MRRRAKKSPMAQINVVPYIDVMLVLLIIFMVTAPLITQGVKVELPHTNADRIAADDKKPLIISLKSDGSLYLNISANPEQSLQQADLIAQVVAAQQKDNKAPILLRADKAATHGMVTEVMAGLQNAGILKLGIVTQAQHRNQP